MTGRLLEHAAAGPPVFTPAAWAALAAVLAGTLAAAAGLAGGVRTLATKLGVVDAPDGRRKRHRKTTPLWGGLAVTAAFVLGACAADALGLLPVPAAAARLVTGGPLTGLLVSAVGFCLVGAWDDAAPMKAREKLIGMFAAAAPFALLGPPVPRLDLPGVHLELGAWGPVFAAIWLVGWANVINLSDGLDGLASGVGFIAAAALAGHAVIAGLPAAAVLAAVFAASLAGFLPHNLPMRRAKLFLGDAGSLTVGAVLGMLSLWASTKTVSGVTAAGVLAAGAVSGFDVLAAIARRKLTGVSVCAADRHHLHHRLQDRGFSVRKTLAVILSLTALTAAVGLAGALLKTPWLAPGLCAGLFAALAAARVFGHHEAALLKTWMGATAGAAWERRPAGLKTGLRVVRPPRRRRTLKRPAAVPAAPAAAPDTIPLPAAAAEPRRRAA